MIGSYPVLTETFIDREVRALERANVDLKLVSIRRPTDNLSDDQRDIQRRVTYLLPPSVGQLTLAVVERHASAPGHRLPNVRLAPHPTAQGWVAG